MLPVRIPAMLAKTKVYKIVQMLETGRGGESAYIDIVTGLEKAMAGAWRQGRVTDECYHLRLYTLMVKDIAEGRKADPNPFANS